MSRRRVLQVVNALAPAGGAETVAANLSRLLRGDWETHVLCLRAAGAGAEEAARPERGPGLEAALEAAGVPVHHLALQGLRDARAGWALQKLLRRLEPAVVHAHNRPSDYWAMAHAALARVPARVYTRHLTYVDLNPSLRRRYAIAAHLAHAVVAVSSAVAGHLVREEGCPPPRITTIPNGVDPARFAPLSAEARSQGTALRRTWGVPEGALIVGSLSRLAHQKGLDQLLRVAADVLQRAPRTVFVLAGEGPARPALERLAATLRIERSVIFPGRQEAPAALAAFDLFLTTSRFEGLPLTLLEAMASGLAAIAPRVGAFPEVLEDGVTGLLPSPRFWAPAAESLDPTPFVEAVLSLLEDGARRKSLGEAARKRVEREFGIASMVSRHESLYARILDAGRRA